MGISIDEKHSPATEFAFDGCHKIYLLDGGEADRHGEDAEYLDGYEIHPIAELPDVWEKACPLRFIYDWALTTTYVDQCHEEDVVFGLDGQAAC